MKDLSKKKHQQCEAINIFIKIKNRIWSIRKQQDGFLQQDHRVHLSLVCSHHGERKCTYSYIYSCVWSNGSWYTGSSEITLNLFAFLFRCVPYRELCRTTTATLPPENCSEDFANAVLEVYSRDVTNQHPFPKVKEAKEKRKKAKARRKKVKENAVVPGKVPIMRRPICSCSLIAYRRMTRRACWMPRNKATKTRSTWSFARMT